MCPPISPLLALHQPKLSSANPNDLLGWLTPYSECVVCLAGTGTIDYVTGVRIARFKRDVPLPFCSALSLDVFLLLTNRGFLVCLFQCIYFDWVTTSLIRDDLLFWSHNKQQIS